MSLKYEFLVAALFLASRLPALGYDSFNTDVWKWKARIFDFGTGVFYLDFAKTIQKYHPGVTLMWLGAVGVKIYNFFYELFYRANPPDNEISVIFGLHFVQKFMIVAAIAVAVALAFYALRTLFGLLYAFIAVFLMSFEPFYIGLSRELHLEGLMSTFMIVSMIWLYYYLRHKKNAALYVSSVFASLSILTKASSLFIIPFAILALLFLGLKKRAIFVWCALVAAFFVLFWPAMWTNPIDALSAVYRGIFTIGVERGHEQWYFGRFVQDPGFTFYPAVFWYRSSIFLILGLVGCTFLMRKKKLDGSRKKFIFYTLSFCLLYVLELTVSSKKLDRYLLPSILGFSLISAFFYEWIVDKSDNVKRFLIGLAVGGVMVMTAAVIHPDYLSFYNPLAGGLGAGIYVIEPKWMIGQRAISAYFKRLDAKRFVPGESLAKLEEDNDKLVVAFPEKYYTQIWPFIREIGGWAVIEDLTPEAKKTKFFVYPVWEDRAAADSRFELVYVDSIKLRGVPIFNVYEKR
ncbi:glycosyltransferase family 39 protein [candidate division WWE3 bacterium]|nr:glycosyltransferase family 39 protein [candidate division WWE3 bacterium]